jgi:hypothetical protein
MKDYKIQRLGGGHRTCNKCGETIFGSKVHHCKKPIASDAVLDDVRELIKCSDVMIKILLYDDKIFHRDEMINWQKQIEKVRAHIV